MEPGGRAARDAPDQAFGMVATEAASMEPGGLVEFVHCRRVAVVKEVAEAVRVLVWSADAHTFDEGLWIMRSRVRRIARRLTRRRTQSLQLSVIRA